MSEKLIAELKTENLCTHFILPLLKLNKFSFMPSNFVNSFIATSTYERDHLFVSVRYVAVQVIDPVYLSRRVYILSEFYGTYRDEHESWFLVYKISSRWINDLDLFLSGKYSEMSKDAKRMIINWSNLAYRQRDSNGTVVTDFRLCALEKERSLKDMWERMIDPREPINGELLSIPDEKTFIDLDTLTRTEPG